MAFILRMGLFKHLVDVHFRPPSYLIASEETEIVPPIECLILLLLNKKGFSVTQVVRLGRGEVVSRHNAANISVPYPRGLLLAIQGAAKPAHIPRFSKIQPLSMGVGLINKSGFLLVTSRSQEEQEECSLAIAGHLSLRS